MLGEMRRLPCILGEMALKEMSASCFPPSSSCGESHQRGVVCGVWGKIKMPFFLTNCSMCSCKEIWVISSRQISSPEIDFTLSFHWNWKQDRKGLQGNGDNPEVRGGVNTNLPIPYSKALARGKSTNREVTLADVFKLAKTMPQSKAAELEMCPERPSHKPPEGAL